MCAIFSQNLSEPPSQNRINEMETSVKSSLPSPKFDKYTSIPSKSNALTSFGLPSLSLIYNDSSRPMNELYKKNKKAMCNVQQPKHHEVKLYCELCKKEMQSRQHLKRHHFQNECPSKKRDDFNIGHGEYNGPSLLDKLKKLSTPEDIAAWREERRKRYPTVANVMLKEKALEQKQKRGERLESSTNRFGNTDDRKRARSFNNVTTRRNHRRGKNNRGKRKGTRTLNAVKSLETKNKTLPQSETLRATAALCEINKIQKAADSNALFSLSNVYASSDNSEDEDLSNNVKGYESNEITANEGIVSSICASIGENISQPFKAIVETNVENNTHVKVTCSKPEDTNTSISNETNTLSDDAPEETPIQREPSDVFKSTSANNATILNKGTDQQKTNHVNKKQSRSIGKMKALLHRQRIHLRKQNTVLERLLEADKRHERNVLLQCVRFVCAQEFFNVCDTKTIVEM